MTAPTSWCSGQISLRTQTSFLPAQVVATAVLRTFQTIFARGLELTIAQKIGVRGLEFVLQKDRKSGLTARIAVLVTGLG